MTMNDCIFTKSLTQASEDLKSNPFDELHKMFTHASDEIYENARHQNYIVMHPDVIHRLRDGFRYHPQGEYNGEIQHVGMIGNAKVYVDDVIPRNQALVG